MRANKFLKAKKPCSYSVVCGKCFVVLVFFFGQFAAEERDYFAENTSIPVVLQNLGEYV